MSSYLPAGAPPMIAPADVPGVHYVSTGDGPRTVVLLHGYADNLTTWSRLIGPLAVDARVIAIDLPGFGRSTRPAPSPLLAGYADVVREVLDAEGVTGPVALVGNSMGAAAATVFAATHPERTDRIVLIDMPGLGGVPAMWRLMLSRPVEIGVRAGAGVVGQRTLSWGMGTAYRFIAAADPRRIDVLARDGFLGPYARRGSVADILPIGRSLLADLAGAGLSALVASLDAPALLVFGARDLLTPARVLRRLGENAGGAVVLPGCGHCPQLDRPAELLEHLLPFLRDEPAVARSHVA